MVNTHTAQEDYCAEVLVVDDRPDDRALMRYLLESFGHHVTLAMDGEEAVSATHDQDFNLILMDLCMPRMGGIEATRAIHAAAPATPIVACSAFLSDEPTRSAGFADTIAKPIAPTTLRRRLEELLAA